MQIWTIFWEIFSIFIYVFSGIIIFIFLFLLIFRLFKIFSLKFKSQKVKKGELIKKKMFQTSDAYDLRWYGEVNSDSKYIILAIHDLLRTRNDFENLVNWLQKNKYKDFSLVSFDQRSCGENLLEKNKNLGALISDIEEIITELSEKFKNQKLILLGEGFGSALAAYFSKNDNVEKIIMSSLRLNFTYKKSFSFYIKLWFGVAFKINTLLFQNINGLDLTDDSTYANKLEDENNKNGSINIREYFQFKKITKKIVKNISNSNSKIDLILPNNDFYCSRKKIVKLINKLDKSKYNLDTFKDKKHFMLNSVKTSEIFEKIIKSV
ncbi:serine aminopeptidase domain-containing protein [Spiroplasma taiwanense]|uniref:Serine aminopeptidase S33 domain-containing protein n=1 Tax=Spiroplasma taiwanense CT-1 TaxID=1276220 RepID=S5LUM1_9MOLU|nr:alpha/beta hydrolase [Spiroplasma taiwanense]AGR41504.1 hypothetical protein STAIW_v1c09180 [Spiroplasma taiwanense CT-1]